MIDDADPSGRRAALTALGFRGGPLRVGEFGASELVERFGSPIYVFDARVVREQVASVRSSLGPRLELLYALKANPNAALARVARLAGTGVEVASAGEILVAKLAGFAGGSMQFAGPGKSDADLAVALEHEVGCINLESEGEYGRVAALCRAQGWRRGVSIRVNPGGAGQAGSRMRMARESSRFGIDRIRVADLARRIVSEDVVNLRGLHVYGGSQCFDAPAWVEGARWVGELAREVERATGRELASLNFGGGFGWAVHDGDPTFDLRAVGTGLRELVESEGREGRRYFVELGRYLTAPAGVYLARVIDIKRSGGDRHAILDGGLHHHGAAAGFGAVIRRAFSIVHCDDPEPSGPTEPVTIGGPLCTPADRFGEGVHLAPLGVGDAVGVLNSGAYGLTYSSTMFLGHPTPAEVLVDGGKAIVVREAGSPSDATRGQIVR